MMKKVEILGFSLVLLFIFMSISASNSKPVSQEVTDEEAKLAEKYELRPIDVRAIQEGKTAKELRQEKTERIDKVKEDNDGGE